jgi:gamma-glutamyltranspeptidase/glutathione hydrolase
MMTNVRSDADPISWKASGKVGAVAAGAPASVAAGIELLRAGGNAADAAAATLLALAVTDYGLFAIGGEIPFMIYDAKKKEVKVLCGLGAAPMSQEAMDWFYEHDIPATGSMKAAPVPGAIDLCITAVKVYGTKSFADVVAPVLKILDAEGGPEWHTNLAKTLRRLVEAETQATGSREERLTAARDCFYKGSVADDLDAWYKRTGAFLRKSDLERHVTRIEDPVAINYRDYTVYKCNTWTQGPTLCQTLRLLEGFDLKNMGHLSADHVHATVEALKLGFADRDTYYADPLFVDVPLKQLLSDEYTGLRRKLIDMKHASLARRPGDPKNMKALLVEEASKKSTRKVPIQDTTTCVVADRWGNVVAATPSCNLLSNHAGALGVTQGNRVRSMNTTPGHPNRVEPGKRPRITLTPTLVVRDGKPVIAISVAGGDLQDQTTLNVLLNHIEFGMTPADAVTAPRFATSHHENSFNPDPDRKATFGKPGGVDLQSRLPAAVKGELENRGHRVTEVSGSIARPVMLLIDHETGMIHVAGDPGAGRHAAALE